MLIIPKIRLGQRGDTIVEVLISILVVSTILGGAYATTNRNMQINRDAQERGNALKLAEAQLEQLKGIVKTNPNSVFGAGAPANMCVNAAGVVINTSSGSCKVNSNNVAGASDSIYSLSTSASTASGTGGHTLTTTVTWPKFGKSGDSTLQLRYRLYE